MSDSRIKTLSGRTIDTCTTCGGSINNRPIHAPRENNRWVHINEEDWINNPHQGEPKGGPVKEEEMTSVGDPEDVRATHEARIREQAEGIATLATAIAAGTVTGPRFAAVARLVDQVDTLRAWTPDDRSGMPKEEEMRVLIDGVSPEQAQYLHMAVAGNAGRVEACPGGAFADELALAALQALTPDDDGYSDGTSVWIAGTRYRVVKG